MKDITFKVGIDLDWNHNQEMLINLAERIIDGEITIDNILDYINVNVQ